MLDTQNSSTHSGDVKLSIAIQHHPSRAHLIPALVERLGGDVEVVTDPAWEDPQPSPLRCYLECIRRTPAWATHRLIVQDDAWPCNDFLPRALAAISEHPGALVPLFVPGGIHRYEMHQARKRGDRFARLNPSMVPTVACSWPVEHARAFLAIEEEKISTSLRPRIGDDGPAGKYAARHRVPIMAPLPSLVQHPDVEPSLIGRKAQAGKNAARVAAWFEGGT